MPDEPTTEGSIEAKLRLNPGSWYADLDRAKAAAEKLATIDPNIRVTADTAEATAQLEAIEAAKDRVNGSSASVSAGGTPAATAQVEALAVAESAVAENATISDEAFAALTASIDANTAATDANTAAVDANVAALDAAAASAAAAAADEDDAAVSADAASASFSTMGGVLVGVISLLGPLASVSAAGAGGLAGLGAAGVLAVLGINAEMKKGTQEGDQYAAGIRSLKSDLDSLENTAAAAVLTDFDNIVEDIKKNLPDLNSEIQGFSGYLGDAVDTGLHGLIAGFKVANPLFVDGAKFIDGISHSFNEWAADGGMKKFVQYAESELPIVQNAVEGAGDAVVALGEDFGPLGNDIADIVGDGGKLLAWLNQLQSDADNLGNDFKLPDWLQNIGGWIQDLAGPLNPVNELGWMQQLGDWVNNLTGAQKTNTGSTKQNADAATDAGNSYAYWKSQMAEANGAAKDLQKELDKLNGVSQSVEQTTDDLAGDYQQMATQFTQNAKAMGKASAESLNVNTAAGLQNHQIILKTIQDAEAKAAAIQKADKAAGDSNTKATALANADLAASKQQIIDHMTALGLDRTAVTKLVDSLLTIPTATITVEDREALAAFAAVEKKAKDLPAGFTATLRGPGYTVTNPLARAGGGFVTGPGSTTSDSVHLAASNNEFVTKASSAQQYPGFMNAYNDNPQKALSAVAASGGIQAASSSAPVIIHVTNKTGVALDDLIDIHIEQAGQWQALHAAAGVSR